VKKTGLLLAIVALTVTGCASYQPMGSFFTEGKMGVQDNGGPTGKEGRACMTSVLALVATGDASIDAAKRDGGITNVSTVNYEVSNVLGIYGKYCTVVQGS